MRNRQSISNQWLPPVLGLGVLTPRMWAASLHAARFREAGSSRPSVSDKKKGAHEWPLKMRKCFLFLELNHPSASPSGMTLYIYN
jgi:hypothetical protein